MKYINDLGHYFCIISKVNSNIKVWKNKFAYHECYFHFKCNLSIARDKLSDDSWFILSNIKPNKALR